MARMKLQGSAQVMDRPAVAAPRGLQRLREGIGRRRMRNADLFLLLLPAVIQVVIFRYLPIGGLQIAFKSFSTSKGIWGSPWIGFDHFLMFFRSYNFWEILGNTLTLSFSMLVFSFPIPFLFALFLNQLRVGWFRKTLQTMSYAPYFISTVVLVGMLYNFFSTSSGIVNLIGQKFGLESVNFLGTAAYFVPLYVGSSIWQTMGYNAVIYIAALSNISPELYEAAKIDGAGKLQRVIHIDFPSLLPTMVVLLIMSIGQIMNIGYEKVYLMQNALNLSKSEIISTYVYKLGLEQARYDFSTAVNLFNTVINFIILMLVNRGAKKLSGASLW